MFFDNNNITYQINTITIINNYDLFDDYVYDLYSSSEEMNLDLVDKHLLKDELDLGWNEYFHILISNLYPEVPFGDFTNKDIQNKYWRVHFRSCYSDEDRCQKYILSKHIGNIYHFVFKFKNNMVYAKIVVISSSYGKINKSSTKYVSFILKDGIIEDISIIKKKCYTSITNAPILIKIDNINNWHHTTELKIIINRYKNNLDQLFGKKNKY